MISGAVAAHGTAGAEAGLACNAAARKTTPVQEMLSTPGPWYSTMAPVPPLTVRMPATLQMMSLGELHLLSLPVSRTPVTCGAYWPFSHCRRLLFTGQRSPMFSSAMAMLLTTVSRAKPEQY